MVQELEAIELTIGGVILIIGFYAMIWKTFIAPSREETANIMKKTLENANKIANLEKKVKEIHEENQEERRIARDDHKEITEKMDKNFDKIYTKLETITRDLITLKANYDNRECKNDNHRES